MFRLGAKFVIEQVAPHLPGVLANEYQRRAAAAWGVDALSPKERRDHGLRGPRDDPGGIRFKDEGKAGFIRTNAVKIREATDTYLMNGAWMAMWDPKRPDSIVFSNAFLGKHFVAHFMDGVNSWLGSRLISIMWKTFPISIEAEAPGEPLKTFIAEKALRDGLPEAYRPEIVEFLANKKLGSVRTIVERMRFNTPWSNIVEDRILSEIAADLEPALRDSLRQEDGWSTEKVPEPVLSKIVQRAI
ncbi:hypothetical protein B0T25DRAFT_578929 [Lasiosphaeria hispida]|uniref:Uncharacterized protein n=1 Tax=Lasiosphaeria hispida TaxID=260671 RepID=A0AAJ0HKV2_9PEZI|nr:hypothetical protein B0T25DRAFT_578929 [Lasiosphaeria hispida]